MAMVSSGIAEPKMGRKDFFSSSQTYQHHVHPTISNPYSLHHMHIGDPPINDISPTIMPTPGLDVLQPTVSYGETSGLWL